MIATDGLCIFQKAIPLFKGGGTIFIGRLSNRRFLVATNRLYLSLCRSVYLPVCLSAFLSVSDLRFWFVPTKGDGAGIHGLVFVRLTVSPSVWPFLYLD